jgi:hypothetical protein
MLMLSVVGGCDFGQEACDHLYDIGDRHGTDFILSARLGESAGSSMMQPTRSSKILLAGKGLNMRQVADLYPAGGGSLGARQGAG